MPAAIVTVWLIATILYLTYAAEKRSRARKAARTYRAILATASRDHGPAPDPNGPRDAIPVGYPGFRGSIRYTPYTRDETPKEN